MSDRKNDRERIERASHSVGRAEKFRQFMSDPDVGLFLEAYEKDQIRKMLSAPLADDEARREAAVAINAMREFVAFVSQAINAGALSAKLLSEKKPNA